MGVTEIMLHTPPTVSCFRQSISAVEFRRKPNSIIELLELDSSESDESRHSHGRIQRIKDIHMRMHPDVADRTMMAGVSE